MKLQRLKSAMCVLICSLGIIGSVHAQHFIQGNLEPEGIYSVGVRDTILIHPTEHFPYGNYEGGKPFFVQIWYPLQERPAGSPMRIVDYLHFSGRDHVADLYDSTSALWKQTIINDGLKPDRRLSLDPDYRWPHDSLLRMMTYLMEITTNAYQGGTSANGIFPVVIYHHGAQSMPFENHLLFEALASNGIVVVSSNYNLANEIMPDMLLRTMDGVHSDEDLLHIVSFTKSLPMVDSDNIYGIGFSAGAQALLKLDMRSEPKPFRAIICLHTTLENRSLSYIKETGYWDDLLPIVDGTAVYATTPTWILAPVEYKINKKLEEGSNQNSDLQFIPPLYIPFAANKQNTPYRFVTIQYPIAHDGLITMGNWRYFIRNYFNFLDRTEMEIEYQAHHSINQFVTKLVLWYADGADQRKEWLLLPFTKG